MNRGDESGPPATYRTPDGAEPRIDIPTLVGIVRGGRWIILVGLILGLAIGVGYITLVTPVYQANALLQVQGNQAATGRSALGAVSMLLPGISAPLSSTHAEIQIMTSRAVLMPVARKLFLDVVIKGAPASTVRIKKLVLPHALTGKPLRLLSRPGHRYILYGPKREKLLTGRTGQMVTGLDGRIRLELARLALPPGHAVRLERIPLELAFRALRSRIHAGERGAGTGLVELTLVGHHPARVSSILNSVIAAYRRENIQEFSAQARRSIAFIRHMLPGLKTRLDETGAQLAAYQSSHNTVNLDEQTKASFSELGRLESQLTELELMQAGYAEQYTRRFPLLAQLRGEENTIRARIAQLHAALERLPSRATEFVRLSEDAAVYGKLFTSLLSTEQDLKIREAGTTGDVRVVESAIPPIAPIAPRRAVDLFIAIVIGLALGLFITFLRHAFTRYVGDPELLEDSFRLPVLAVIPHSRLQQVLYRRARRRHTPRYPLLAEADPEDLAVEALRSLRTSTEYALASASNRVISLGGPRPGCGKSFVSANFAWTLASAGKRVLIVDADLRRGTLHRYFGPARVPGLAEVLSGTRPWQTAVQKGTVDFLPSGEPPDHPSELLMKPELAHALAEMAEAYDFVLIDLPPILAVADGLAVGRHASLNLIVIKADYHSLEEVRATLQRYRQSGVAVHGFVFNDLKPLAPGYGYRYHYRYRHGKEQGR